MSEHTYNCKEHLIKDLICRLEKIKTEPVASCPCVQKQRYQIDWDSVPLIVNDSVLEIRPTNELKKMKQSGFKNDKIFVRINSPHNPHASPPWYHPCDPAFIREKTMRDKKEDIFPTNDLQNTCQISKPDDTCNQREMQCSCSYEKPKVTVCKWKEYQPCKQEQDDCLCSQRR